MFDIGFSELVLVAVVGLLVIGPERLPETIRTASLWLNRLKRGFNDIKREVQQELHNDAVMQELRKTGAQIKAEADSIGKSVDDAAGGPAQPTSENSRPGAAPTLPTDKTDG